MNWKDKITAYLDGQLGPEEEKGFEEALKNDASLARETQEQSDFQSLLKDTYEYQQQKEEIARVLQKVNAQMTPVAPVSQVRPLWSNKLVRMAAILIPLALAFGWLMRPQYTNIYFLDNFNTTYLGQGVQMSGEENEKSAFENAFKEGKKLYKKADYSAAIERFQLAAFDSLLALECHLYIGTAYLNKNDAQSALPYLEKAAQDEDLEEYTRWYMAMSYIQLGEDEKARHLLNEIVNSDRLFQKEAASQALNNLNSVWR